ncbi:MOSC domain-containing protein [Nocardioides terrisoli]|uniref:MOSC domain-containing protein n=1 Tax=Nocardioides terrisoli TaxID=3388267 RepID=UPI00287B610C|nr:MOSC domain-containing protein [Nocardioides marmorisolisilvae]
MRVHRVGLSTMKGARHEERDEVELAASGPVDDRILCVVDVESRAVLRTVANPMLLRTRAHWSDPVLRLELPGGEVTGELDPGEVLDFDYWGRRPALRLQSSVHAAALSDLLGLPVRLARVTTPADVVYGAPVTIVTTSDLAELGSRAGVPDLLGEFARFRATLTLDDGSDPLPTDATGVRVQVGTATIELLRPIPRCAVIDLDPWTGQRNRHLLETLAGYRREAGEIWFGHYARVVSPGRCAAGDRVRLVDPRE